MSNIDLKKCGWNDFFKKEKESSPYNDFDRGRVISVHRSKYEVITNDGIFSCKILGKIQFNKNPILKPVVGDWVVLEKKSGSFVIVDILERRNVLKRQKKHDRLPKPIAANVDRAIIMQSADSDLNIKRIERILVHVYDAGITPVIVINKIDLVAGYLDKIRSKLKTISNTIDIIYVSYKEKIGLDDLENVLVGGETIVFIGSSGVGKSSLINFMFKENIQNTQTVMNKTGRGRHTTTSRRLILLSNGVLVIDSPGTREFGIYDDPSEAIKQSFDDIESIVSQCKFSNCSHSNEPECAIQEALKNGDLDSKKYKQYLALQLESSQTAKQIRQSEKQSSKRRANIQPLRSIRRGK